MPYRCVFFILSYRVITCIFDKRNTYFFKYLFVFFPIACATVKRLKLFFSTAKLYLFFLCFRYLNVPNNLFTKLIFRKPLLGEIHTGEKSVFNYFLRIFKVCKVIKYSNNTDSPFLSILP